MSMDGLFPEETMRRSLALFVSLVAVACLVCAAPAWAQAGTDKQAPPAQDKDKAAAADPVSGEWEGLVDLPDGPTPFSMKLKLEKDKVTGEVAGPQGAAAISEGSWADGKLAITFTYVDGAAIVMTGSLAEGQFAGSLSYGGGQMVVNWAAKKKAAK
jgi:hypothetical protein